jgi:hypothetical protein
MTCPGLGEIRTAQLLSTVVTPYRFSNKRSFWSYCGLAIVMRSSSDWVPDAWRGVGENEPPEDAGSEPEPQPNAQADLQGSGDNGHRAPKTEPLGNGAGSVLAVGNVAEDIGFDPLAPDHEPLGMAGGAQVAALATEGDEEGRAAPRAADVHEAVLEEAAVQEALDDFATAPRSTCSLHPR